MQRRRLTDDGAPVAGSLGERVHEVEHNEAKAMACEAVAVVAWSGENADGGGAHLAGNGGRLCADERPRGEG